MSFRGREFSPGQSSLPPGTQLNSTYEINELINAGGMGEVYRGHNIATGDPVAIKVVLPEYAADQLILDLFRKEARILFQLTHDAIVRYYGFASDKTINRSYMAMEFVEGLSLADRMKTGPLSVEEVSGLRVRVADGLQKAHDLGIIHRDISPENVILQGGQVNRAKIIDFGIAKSSALASEGTLIGTSFAGRYNFASPEQVGMFRPATVSPRSDIYSFGLVLAAALLGQPIDMSGTMAEIMEKRMEVPDLSAIPVAIRGLLTAMLQPNPADRIATMAEVRDWPVETGAETPLPQARPIPKLPPRSSPSKRPLPAKPPSKAPPRLPPAAAASYDEDKGSRLGMWIGGAVVGVVLAGAAGGWFYVQSRVNQLQPPQEKPAVVVQKEAPPKPAPEPAAPQPEFKTPPPEVSPQPEAPPQPEAGGTTSANGKQPREPAPAPPAEEPPAAEAPAEIKPAETPPAPPAPSAATIGKDLRNTTDLVNFVLAYDGGACFFAWPEDIQPGAARISGYAADETLFNPFLKDFEQVSGIADPQIDINVRKVSADQCVVVDAIRQLARGKTPKPNLDIPEQTVAIGDTLSGTVLDLPGRHLELLFVNEKGETFKATSLLNGTSFNLPMKQKKPSGSETPLPQLVVVVSSPEPLTSLATVSMKAPAAASTVFPQLTEEAASNGRVAVAVTYVKLVVPGE